MDNGILQRLILEAPSEWVKPSVSKAALGFQQV
jgi:hypothetical protein